MSAESSGDAKRCFVIGPIGDKFAPLGSDEREQYEAALDVYEKVIYAACVEHSLEPVRADQISVTGEITEQVFRHLYEDEVVIADVSGGNPNVMYELGLRHTRDLLTITIGEYGQLPFDVAAVRTIKFSRSDRGLIDARKALSQALAVGLIEGPDPVTATRVWAGARDTPSATVMVPAIESDTDESQSEDGLIEWINRVEATFPLITANVENVGEILASLGGIAEELGVEMERLNVSGAPSSARLSLMAKYGQRMQAPATLIESEAASFSANMDQVNKDVSEILHLLVKQPQLMGADAAEFVDSVEELARTSRDGMEQLTQVSIAVESIGPLSKSLRRPARTISLAIKAMADSISLIDEWDALARKARRSTQQSLDEAASGPVEARQPSGLRE